MNELNNKELFREKVNSSKLHTLAQKLKCGEVDVNDLKDEEIDEMILFFSESIKQKDRELYEIKDRIKRIKNEE